ncbi:MAG: AMP-binding protein [Alphaproteobacteria bacterium]
MRFFADELESFGDSDAVVTPDGERVSYRELANRADAFAASLGKTRRLLIIETLNELPPLVAYLGALRGRHPVILAGDGSTAKDDRTSIAFEPYAVFRKSDRGWALDTLNEASSVPIHDDLAVLLSTSGSTGSPKLVRLSRENIGSNAQAIAEYLELESSARPITALPFHYSYGMSVINSHLAVGATLLLTNESVTSSKFWSFFNEQQATSIAGVPYTFDLLDRMGFRDWELNSLKQVTQAGGRLAPEKVRDYALWANRHAVKFFVMYGQTEAAPRMAYVPPQDIAENSDCIGVPIPGGAFKIIDEQGREVDPGEQGELVYYGPNVMMGYALGKADLARGAEVSELATGDLACRTPGGLYRIVGRKSRFSKLFGLRLSFDEIEGFLAKQGVTAAVTGDDERIVVCADKKSARQRIVELVAGKYSVSPSAIATVQLPEIPRLPSGKIDYRLILSTAANQASKRRAKNAEKTGARGSLRESFGWALGRPDISAEDTFVSLGGDSLSYVEVSLAIERYLGYLPEAWEDMPIGELERLKAKAGSGGASLPTDIVLRFAGIMGVIFCHASELPLAGGSDVLLIIAGYSLARFQLAKLMTGSPWPVILRYWVNFVLIYYAIALVYVPIFDGGLSLKKLWWIATVDYVPGPMFYLWFIQVLFQSVVLISLPFLIPALRNWVKRAPWLSGCALLTASIALHFVTPKINIPGLYDNATFDNFFMVALGWCLYFTATQAHKLVVAAFAVFVVIFIFFQRAVLINEGIWVLCAMPLLLWTKRLPVPAGMLVLISNIASASFYIYLMQFGPLIEIGAMGGHWWRIPDFTVQSLGLGLALWSGFRMVTRLGAKIKLPAFNWRWGAH